MATVSISMGALLVEVVEVEVEDTEAGESYPNKLGVSWGTDTTEGKAGIIAGTAGGGEVGRSCLEEAAVFCGVKSVSLSDLYKRLEENLSVTKHSTCERWT